MPVACRRDSDREPLARGGASGNEGCVPVGGQLRLVPVNKPVAGQGQAFPGPSAQDLERPGGPSGSIRQKVVGGVSLGTYLDAVGPGSACFCCGTALLAVARGRGLTLTCPQCAAQVERV